MLEGHRSSPFDASMVFLGWLSSTTTTETERASDYYSKKMYQTEHCESSYFAFLSLSLRPVVTDADLLTEWLEMKIG